MLLAIVNLYSVRIAARLLNWLSSMKLLALVFVIILGVWKLIQHGGLERVTLSYTCLPIWLPSTIAKRHPQIMDTLGSCL